MKRGTTIAAVVLAAASIFGQAGGSVAPTDAISEAMGRAGVASSRGIFAPGMNPANLVLSRPNRVEFNLNLPLPSLNFRFGSDMFSIDDYNYYFSSDSTNAAGERVGRFLSVEDEEKLRGYFADGGRVVAEAATNLFGVSVNLEPKIGAFALTVNESMIARAELGETYSTVAFEGILLNNTYDFSDVDLAAWHMRKYALSYARDLDFIKQREFERIAAGVTLNYYTGFLYFATERMGTFVRNNDVGVLRGEGDVRLYAAAAPMYGMEWDFDSLAAPSAPFAPFPEPAGSGFGFDLGVSATVGEKWTLGIALTDVGGIVWDNRPVQYDYSQKIFMDDALDAEQRESVENGVVGEGKYVEDGDVFSAAPMAIRMGGAANVEKFIDGFPGTMVAALDYHQGLNSSPGNSTVPRFALGVDWKPGDGYPFVRMGTSVGGGRPVRLAFGLGTIAGPFELAVTTSDFHNVFIPMSARRFSFSFSTRWIVEWGAFEGDDEESEVEKRKAGEKKIDVVF
ncbi:MAG: hypothetical protein GF419_04190 [Ignavibacteriales bacterium]|nr:hypothetical protein [Ignavibacteriales bacterium]